MGITLSPLQYVHNTNHRDFAQRKLPVAASLAWAHPAPECEPQLEAAAPVAPPGGLPGLPPAHRAQRNACVWEDPHVWEDFNGFLTPMVACENSISQTHSCVYLHVHTFLRFREETQKGLSRFLLPPSCHTSFPSVRRARIGDGWW